MEAAKEQSEASVWRAELMRLTAFITAGARVDLESWWKDCVGEPPESKTEKLRESIRTLEGHALGGKFVLNATLERVDWVLGIDIDLERNYSEMPNLGPYQEVLAGFNSVVVKWLPTSPPCTRLAWGASLNQPVNDRIAGYKMLQGYLHSLKLDPENSSELFYQINRPRRSNVIPDLKINRLQKWSVPALNQLSMLVAGGKEPTGRFTHPQLTACRVDLDINTAGDRVDPIPADKLMKIYAELVESGREITVKGEVP